MEKFTKNLVRAAVALAIIAGLAWAGVLGPLITIAIALYAIKMILSGFKK